jgi:hypothetical protein
MHTGCRVLSHFGCWRLVGRWIDEDGDSELALAKERNCRGLHEGWKIQWAGFRVVGVKIPTQSEKFPCPSEPGPSSSFSHCGSRRVWLNMELCSTSVQWLDTMLGPLLRERYPTLPRVDVCKSPGGVIARLLTPPNLVSPTHIYIPVVTFAGMYACVHTLHTIHTIPSFRETRRLRLRAILFFSSGVHEFQCCFLFFLSSSQVCMYVCMYVEGA